MKMFPIEKRVALINSLTFPRFGLIIILWVILAFCRFIPYTVIVKYGLTGL